MPEHLSIPPIDLEFVEEIKQLVEESDKALRHGVGVLAKRVGDVMERMDELQWDLPDEASVDNLRYVTGYDELMDAWSHIAGNAAAAADHPAAGLPKPWWYDRLLEQRRQRVHREALEA
jgi:hypothetical protein